MLCLFDHNRKKCDFIAARWTYNKENQFYMYDSPWRIIKIKVNWQEKVIDTQLYFARFPISTFANASEGVEITSLLFRNFIWFIKSDFQILCKYINA